MRRLTLALTMVVGLLTAGWAVAQEDGSGQSAANAEGVERAEPAPRSPRGPRGDLVRRGPVRGRWAPNDETRELLAQVMIARVSQELALDDEQTVVLVRRFMDMQDQRREAHDRMRELRRELEALLEAGQDNAAIEAKLAELRALHDAMHEARQSMLDELGTELTAWQRGKLYLFLGDFDDRIRHLLREAHQQRRFGRGGGPMRGGPPGPPPAR